MKTIQVLLDAELLRAADQAVKKLNINRSALLREALREHLKRLEVRDREAKDREGFTRFPDLPDESAVWDKFADWPSA